MVDKYSQYIINNRDVFDFIHFHTFPSSFSSISTKLAWPRSGGISQFKCVDSGKWFESFGTKSEVYVRKTGRRGGMHGEREG